MSELAKHGYRVIENRPLWGSYVCDAALPGKGSPYPIAESFRLLTTGLGYPHMTNMLKPGGLPALNAFEATGVGVRLCFSHEQLYELAKSDLSIEFRVSNCLVETLSLNALLDHENEDFEPFPDEVPPSGVSRIYWLEPSVTIAPEEDFDLVLNLERDLLVALQSAEWALRFHPDSDAPHGLDWRPYTEWYAEIRGFLVGNYVRSYL